MKRLEKPRAVDSNCSARKSQRISVVTPFELNFPVPKALQRSSITHGPPQTNAKSNDQNKYSDASRTDEDTSVCITSITKIHRHLHTHYSYYTRKSGPFRLLILHAEIAASIFVLPCISRGRGRAHATGSKSILTTSCSFVG